jgi:hypothetical protein
MRLTRSLSGLDASALRGRLPLPRIQAEECASKKETGPDRIIPAPRGGRPVNVPWNAILRPFILPFDIIYDIDAQGDEWTLTREKR